MEVIGVMELIGVEDKSNPEAYLSMSGLLKILGILIAFSALGGCLENGSMSGTGLPAKNITEDILDQNGFNGTVSNQIYWTIVTKELDSSGNLKAKLRIMNPVLNQSVLTIFKNEFGNTKAYSANITSISNNNWTKNFSLKMPENASFVLVKVQITEKNKVVKTVENNITFAVPIEKAILSGSNPGGTIAR